MRRGAGHCAVILLMAEITLRLANGQALSFLSEYSVSAAGGTSPADLAVDASGVYTAGTIPSQTVSEGFLRKSDLAGRELWIRRFGEESNAAGVTVAADGVYVAGTGKGTAAGGQRDVVVRKFDPEGNLLWTRKLGSADDEIGLGVASGGGFVYVVWMTFAPVDRAQGHITKFDSDGAELWTRDSTPRGSMEHVAADSTGVYVTGAFFTGGPQAEAFVRKYDTAGSELWTSRIEVQAASAGGLAVDSTGAYVSGKSGQSIFLRKYSFSGGLIWQRLAGTNGGFIPRVAVDDSGAYLMDVTPDALPGQCTAGLTDVTLRKYDLTAGAELWTRQLGTVRDDFAAGVALSPAGVYIGAASYPLKASPKGMLAKIEKVPRPADGRPRIRWECVLNAASYEGGGVAPGEIVTVLGEGIGPARPEGGVHEEGRLTTTVAQTRVLFDGVAAPLVYVSSTQTTAIVPYGVAAKPTVEIVVEHRGARSESVNLPVLPARPGIFTANSSGRGPAAAINQDGTVNSLSNPAERGSVISIFVTGEGVPDPPVDDGAIVTGPHLKPKLPVEVGFGSRFEDMLFGNAFFPAEVLYAGSVPGLAAGLLQVNVRIPAALPGGRASLWQVNLSVGDETVAAGFLHESPIEVVVR